VLDTVHTLIVYLGSRLDLYLHYDFCLDLQDQVKVNILMAQAEGEKLSLRIVQSPERVKAEQDRAKNRIMALKSTQDEKQRRLGELQRQKDGLVAQQQNVDKAVRHMRDISNDSDRLE